MDLRKISIVVPLHRGEAEIIQNIEKCLLLDYPDYEVIVVVDDPVKIQLNSRARLLKTGLKHTSPARKRDIALSGCRGEIIAFLDEDAYPRRDWLLRAATYFEQEDVDGVCGPGLTPPESPIMERASGLVLSSIFGGGNLAYRYSPRKSRTVDEYPAYNLFIRKSLLTKVGGFGSDLYGGEEAELFRKIQKLGKTIRYEPDVIVYHRPRPLFRQYVKQIWNYAKRRGISIKEHPEISLRFCFLLPSLFLLALVIAFFIAFIIPLFALGLFLTAVSFYLLLLIVGYVGSGNFALAFLFPLGVLTTHFTYGVAFMFGLFSRV